MTPLGYAVESGNMEIVQLLVEAKADVNAKDVAEETPLHYAAQAGKIKLVQFLIEAGADVNAKAERGRTLLHFVLDVDRRRYKLFKDVAELLMA